MSARLRGRLEGGKCVRAWGVWGKELLGMELMEKPRRAEENSTWVLLSASALEDDKHEGLEPMCGKIRTSILLKTRCPVQNLNTGSVYSKCLRIQLERDFSRGL